MHLCKHGFPIPPMCKTVILEPIKFDSEEDEHEFKPKWQKIHRYLKECGMALKNITTYDKMLSELEMTHDDYIKAVQTLPVRPKLFLKCRVCQISISNYMKNCLHFWHANHDIHSVLDSHAMMQYTLSMQQKCRNMFSIIMDHVCQEA